MLKESRLEGNGRKEQKEENQKTGERVGSGKVPRLEDVLLVTVPVTFISDLGREVSGSHSSLMRRRFLNRLESIKPIDQNFFSIEQN